MQEVSAFEAEYWFRRPLPLSKRHDLEFLRRPDAKMLLGHCLAAVAKMSEEKQETNTSWDILTFKH
jgi:hypothetical protein